MKFIIRKQTKKPAPFMPAEIWNYIYEIKEDMEKAPTKQLQKQLCLEINTIVNEITNAPADDYHGDIAFNFRRNVYMEKYYEGGGMAYSGKHQLNGYEWAEYGAQCYDRDDYDNQAAGTVSYMWWM